jgi:pSer/pThr/pTyr-binding forkhead associated (FHA) protein
MTGKRAYGTSSLRDRPSVMKSFLTACGLAGPLQLVVESQSAEGGELRLLHQPFALIGRDPRADLVLDHARVSRRHVYFQVIEGRAFWVDLVTERRKSLAGWRVDGHFASDHM